MGIADVNGTRHAYLAAGSYFSGNAIKWHQGLNIGKPPLLN
jgi:hypothetical protein